MTQSEKLGLRLNRWSDQTIGDHCYISLHHLPELKEGLADPSEQSALALKSLLRGIGREAEIDQYLVTPFRSET